MPGQPRRDSQPAGPANGSVQLLKPARLAQAEFFPLAGHDPQLRDPRAARQFLDPDQDGLAVEEKLVAHDGMSDLQD